MASALDGVQSIQRTEQRANRSAKQSIALDAEPQHSGKLFAIGSKPRILSDYDSAPGQQPFAV
jgi:hypothetical protein